eukprot:TRINITY_DN32562_c0_g1_i1.p1 TRINITY_DN32562_c0_g1~~TRINITY_DN32562_c0_g1_i1.p1  ORF type:complete len:515 (-),score=76.66 TRINITY_DN32562_c0_g1_i1:74-1591(-)
MSCFLTGPSLVAGLTSTISEVIATSEGSQALITVSGSCPEGHELSFTSKTVQCSIATGWAEEPTCSKVKCPNDFGAATSTNCTGDNSIFGDVCALTCSLAATGTPVAQCGPFGLFMTDYSCGEPGTVYSCGDGTNYGLGSGALADVYSPAKADLTSTAGTDVSLVAAAYDTMCYVKGVNALYCTGSNDHNLVDFGGAGSFSSPYLRPEIASIASGSRIEKLETGIYHAGILFADGRVYTWGGGQYSMLHAAATGLNAPTLVQLPAGRTAVDLVMDTFDSIVTLDDGTLFGGGNNQGLHLHGSLRPLTARILESSLPAGAVIDHIELSYLTFVVKTNDKRVFGRENNGSQYKSYCGSSISEVFTEAGDTAGGDLSGHITSVTCNRQACVFVTDQDKVFGCSAQSNGFAGHGVSGTVPYDVTSALDGYCSGGKARTFWKSQDAALYFGGTECDQGKIFGFTQQTNFGKSVCQSSANVGQVYMVMNAAPKKILDVASYRTTVIVNVEA